MAEITRVDILGIHAMHDCSIRALSTSELLALSLMRKYVHCLTTPDFSHISHFPIHQNSCKVYFYCLSCLVADSYHSSLFKEYMYILVMTQHWKYNSLAFFKPTQH